MKGWGALARWAPFFDDLGASPSSWSPSAGGGGGGGGGLTFGFKQFANPFAITKTPFTYVDGDVKKVIYTCPVGKQALGLDLNVSNGLTVERLVETPQGPMIYGVPSLVSLLATLFLNGAVDLGDINAGGGGGQAAITTIQFAPLVMQAGDTLSITPAAGQGNCTQGQIVMLEAAPADTGLVVVRGNTPVVANTVVYTCPLGKHAIIWNGSSNIVYFGRTVAATPLTHVHGNIVPAGEAAIPIEPGGSFSGSLAGGANGPSTTNVNNQMGILGPGDEIELWQDNTGFQTQFSFVVQEV